MLKQQIRFCASADGTQIAYALVGHGRPLVRVAHWLTHLERDWHSPLRRPMLEAMGHRFRLVRYDARDTGVSDRDVERVTLDAWVEDLAAVLDDLGTDPVPLFAAGEGGPVAIRYAVRHPDRVSSLVLLGSFALGRAHRVPSHRGEVEAAAMMMRYWWDEPHSGVREMWTTRAVPGATEEQRQWLNDLQRWSIRAASAERSYRTATSLDVRSEARELRLPTLVLHAMGDALVPFDCGRELSGLIPEAVLVPLESSNHELLPGEPAHAQLLDELSRFLGVQDPGPAARLGVLTRREAELVDLLACGLDNAAIADRLVISPRTVRNHVSHVFAKLGVRNRAEAIVLARESGLGGRHDSFGIG